MATVSFSSGEASAIELPLRQFDAEEYMAMAEAGVFALRQRVELIGGYIVDMSPAGSEHSFLVQRLNQLFIPLLETFNFRVQGTLRVDDQHVLDPDLMLLKLRTDGYRHENPTPADVSLLIEVADASRYRDAKVKLPIYAQADVSEYWIVDVQRTALIVHRQPSGERYANVREFKGDEATSPLAAPTFSVTPRRIFD